ncbi:MAG: SH3 domain-containing protein [Pseudomonadota bacterium]|uniref:SH3b domain-containing protein n=1 Tax=marine metagenome TaxID=408172 RepID=A0A381QTC0_9ZZZZ|nr:SH3 domain-containing protein [Pseudomonadota bacterium]HBP14379.1 hypothetical protein [Gammaproteobacteria bacterium]|tara:strand:+ start:14252 stop:14917 length:666 start_codon:yes stop_codon:yes gene_type:complete
MKSITTFLSVLVLCSYSFGAPDEEEDRLYEKFYDSGRLQIRGMYIAGEMDGVWEDFYENGRLRTRGTYLAGKKTGPWESFYPNGQVQGKGTLQAGKQQGVEERYYESGQLLSRGTFQDGRFDGLWETYYSNGKLISRTAYRDGKQSGTAEYFDLVPMSFSSADSDIYVVTAESLNVRSSPGGAVVRTLARGESVTVASTKGDWSQLSDGNWVASGFITKVQ